MNKKSTIPHWWYHIGLSLLVLVSYVNGFTNEFTSDDVSLYANSHVLSSWSSVTSQKIYFLQPLLHFFVYQITGPVAIGFRLLSVLFHLLSVNMIFLLVSMMVAPVAALFVAALFAVHPLLVESVTWISGGPYAWSTSLFLLSFYLYLRSAKSENKWIYIFSIVSYWLSLTVGLTATALVAVFVLYEYCFGDLKKKWLRLIPYAGLSLIYGMIAIWGIGARLDSFQNTLAWEIPEYSIFQIPYVISKYLELYVWPIGISHYQIDVLDNPVRVVIFFAFVAALVYSFIKNKYVFFGLATFVVSLVPTLVPIGVHWLVADRYVYAGVFGLAFSTGYLMYLASLHEKYQKIVYTTFSIIIILLCIRTVMRNNDWKNNLTLWQATVKTSPDDPKGHNNLADAYVTQGNFPEAFKELEIALKLNPKYSDAYHNAGHAYEKIGNPQEAQKYYLTAIKFNPNQWQSYHNLGLLYYKAKDYKTAAEYIKKAISLNPQYAVLYTDLGVMHYYSGSKQEAQQAFLKALQLDPTSQMAQLGYQESLK